MDEIVNKPQALGIEPGGSRKPYQQPKLTPLGSIHSLVRAVSGVGADGGGTNDSHAS